VRLSAIRGIRRRCRTRSGISDTACQGHFRETWHLSRDCQICQFRPAREFGFQAGRPVAVDIRRPRLLPEAGARRQDFSLQNAATLPLNDARVFVATMRVLAAASPVKSLWSLSPRDKLRVLRTLALAQLQSRQPIKSYQQLRYWNGGDRCRVAKGRAFRERLSTSVPDHRHQCVSRGFANGVPAVARLTCTWMISRRTRTLFSEMTVPVLMSH
jgi:hypothetical protein